MVPISICLRYRTMLPCNCFVFNLIEFYSVVLITSWHTVKFVVTFKTSHYLHIVMYYYIFNFCYKLHIALGLNSTTEYCFTLGLQLK